MRGSFPGVAIVALALAMLVPPLRASSATDHTLSHKRDEREWEELAEQFSKAYSQKRFDEALRRAEDMLQLAKRAFGPDDPKVATALSNLAGASEALGDYSRIEPLLQQALAIRVQALGANHPDTAKALTNLGRFKHFHHQYAEAESLYQRALAIHEGIQDVDRNEFAVANALHDLAVLYRDQEQYAKAAQCVKRELDIWQAKFGPEHPLALPIIDMYAEMSRRIGDSRKAESLEAQADRIRAARGAAATKK